MSAKSTGAEFKRFYNDGAWWADGAYHEDETITVDGVLLGDFSDDLKMIPDAAKVVIEDGVVFFDSKDSVSFEDFFKRWKKSQTTRSVVVEIDASKLDSLISAVKAAGGRIL